MKKNESINLMIHTEEWKPDGFLLPEQRKIRKVSSWSGAAESETGEISRRGCERVIIITCSDQGIAAAGKMHLPVIAVRNPQYDRIRGEQSLFGAPLLLERTEDLEEPLLEEVWKRHYGIPLTIGQTLRCRIREISESDLTLLCEAAGGLVNEGGTVAFLPERGEYAVFWEAYIRNQYAFFGYGLWLIERKLPEEKNEAVGIAGFTEAGEMGYWIFPEFRRRGYAEEVCRFLLKYAGEVLNWEMISLFIEKENLPSLSLAKRLDFCFDAECERDGRSVQRWIRPTG